MRTPVAARRVPGVGPAPRRLCVILLILASAACGKKGPPLAPFPRVPAAVSGLTAERVGSEVHLTIPVPAKNADGHAPADLERLEVFAITAMSAPETEAHRKLATLVATLPVRPVVPAPADAAGAPPPASLLPGFDQGTSATFNEPLTPDLHVPVELPKPKGVLPRPLPAADAPPFGPLVAPPPADLGRRYYFVVGVSPRGRRGALSSVVSIPFGDASSAPGAPEVTYTARVLTIKWTAPPNARTASLAPVRPPKRIPTSTVPGAPPLSSPSAPGDAPAPVAGAPTPGPTTPGPTTAAAATPGATTPGPASPAGPTGTGGRPTTPAVPTPPPLLSARSIGFTTQATTYHVYEVPGDASADPAAHVALPKALTPQPLDEPEFTLTGLKYGVERCFVVRAVDRLGGVSVQGTASPRTCVTPADTFAPAAPQSLAAIGGQGVINLIWEPNSEPDLAGYIVLRGEAPDGTLQRLTPDPIRETTFADRTARPGVRYVYAVVAVDTATVPNVSAQSNRVEEATRQ